MKLLLTQTDGRRRGQLVTLEISINHAKSEALEKCPRTPQLIWGIAGEQQGLGVMSKWSHGMFVITDMQNSP